MSASMALPEELQLLQCVVLSGGIFLAAYRLARRMGGGSRGQTICDAFLLYFLAQYLAIGIPGLLHHLTASAISIVGVGECILLVYLTPSRDRAYQRPIPGRPPTPLLSPDARGDAAATIAGLFVTGYLGAYLWNQRWIPPMATDSLVYQLSTAVDWLRHGTLAVFPTWYWNPANSYAPQCSTCAIVWLMAPLKCDVLARYVQAPVILWLFMLCYRLGQQLQQAEGGSEAAWVAAACVLSRPLFSEALFAKDDLLVTAFVATAVLALDRHNLQDRLGPWRVGAAFGMMLASKYTVLMVCPLFLFLADAPFRARWKQKDWAIAALVALVLSMPWYVRNLLLTGNPLYPVDVKFFGMRVFTGLFATERDRQLRSAGGVWQMLSATYHSLPSPLLIALLLLWIAALPAAGRSLLRDPLRRACLLGAPLVLALFLVASPHHEVRYLFSLLVLWFAAASLAIGHWARSRALAFPGSGYGGAVIAIILAAISAATTFKLTLMGQTVLLVVAGAATAVVGAMVIASIRRRPALLRAYALLLTVAGGIGIYVFWHAYVRLYRQGCVDGWSIGYPDEVPAWKHVRDELPPGETVAFANTQFTYPLYGFYYDRMADYAPARRGLRSFVALPRIGDTVPGDLIVNAMARAMNDAPDRQSWLENLRAMHAGFLLVFRHGVADNPPELRFAAMDSKRFIPVLADDPAAVIYRIDW